MNNDSIEKLLADMREAAEDMEHVGLGGITRSHMNARLHGIADRLEAMTRATFQSRVNPWMQECFGPEISADTKERNHRFFEEATELVQSLGMSRSEAYLLVDYVYGRPDGEPTQEVGGVMVTLAALCLSHGIDMHKAGEVELSRVWTKIDVIRAKQASKPKHSPLPMVTTPSPSVPEGWQPIETAPKDGRDILIFCSDTKEQMVAFWNGRRSGWQFAADPYSGPHIAKPTQWQPLPAAPKGVSYD